jgi:hypothetical protein
MGFEDESANFSALPWLYKSVSGQDKFSANKPIIQAPYFSVRIPETLAIC